MSAVSSGTARGAALLSALMRLRAQAGAAPVLQADAEPVPQAGVQPALQAEGVCFGAGGRALLDGVSLSVQPGQVLAVVGPNGAGKTTLLRVLTGRLSAEAGEVRLLGRPLAAYPAAERARHIGVLAQENEVAFALTAWEVAEMGRYPRLGRFARPLPHDRAVVSRALERMAVADLSRRSFPTLSGGEKQRVLLARALAQEPAVLLLDEPTANLDVNHALEMMMLVRQLADEEQLAVVLVEHGLAYARRFADRVLALKAGRVFAEGAPERVLARASVAALFDVRPDLPPEDLAAFL